MPHPDEGLIHEWLDGELSAAEAARVEALVASDPEWSAAAAEARGLIAATSRIVGALDHVPAQVIPKAVPSRGSSSLWIWRAAAALVLVAGSAVVLQKESPELLPAPTPVAKEQPAAPTPQASTAPTNDRRQVATAAPPTEKRSNLQPKELDAVKKQTEPSRDKDARLADANSISTAGNINRPAAAPAPIAASGAAAGAPAPQVSQRAAAAKAEARFDAKVATAVSCFEQRVPADSASRIIRLDAAQLEDSVRLEKLTLRGDTLAAVHARLIAVRVRCP